MCQLSCRVPACVFSFDSYMHLLRPVRLFSFLERNERSKKAWTLPQTHRHAPTKKQCPFLNLGLSGSHPLLLMVKAPRFSAVTLVHAAGVLAHKGDPWWQLSMRPGSGSPGCAAQVCLALKVGFRRRGAPHLFNLPRRPLQCPEHNKDPANVAN